MPHGLSLAHIHTRQSSKRLLPQRLTSTTAVSSPHPCLFIRGELSEPTSVTVTWSFFIVEKSSPAMTQEVSDSRAKPWPAYSLSTMFDEDVTEDTEVFHGSAKACMPLLLRYRAAGMTPMRRLNVIRRRRISFVGASQSLIRYVLFRSIDPRILRPWLIPVVTEPLQGAAESQSHPQSRALYLCSILSRWNAALVEWAGNVQVRQKRAVVPGTSRSLGEAGSRLYCLAALPSGYTHGLGIAGGHLSTTWEGESETSNSRN